MNLTDLANPFPPDRVSWRVGSTTGDKKRGMALAYIDARDVMERLDEVCGIGGWQNAYPHANGKTVCAIGIKIGDEWIWKADGAGDTDVEKEKGALSDAFKRAAVRWGIGRYLYDLDSPWVELEAAGRSFKIAAKEMPRLRSLLGAGSSIGTERGNPAPEVAGSSPAQPAKPVYELIDPETGMVAERLNLAKDFMAALRQRMTKDDPTFWWGPNHATAKLIVERHPQAKDDYDSIEQLALRSAA